jgi:hypothetical protein
MDTSTMIILTVVLVGGIAGLYFYSYFKDKRSMRQANDPGDRKPSNEIRLQAYERLVLLADRIAIPNVITRMNQSDVTARELQMLLIQTIKQEFDHNITQQIYVSEEAWEAIRNLKEQNILIINQVASFLPENAPASELNKSLVDLLVQNPNASLHNIVSEALSYEAKKLM